MNIGSQEETPSLFCPRHKLQSKRRELCGLRAFIPEEYHRHFMSYSLKGIRQSPIFESRVYSEEIAVPRLASFRNKGRLSC
ncbi:hypothetical protein RRG08_051385 [Elysia crispata]|uniref:Uncharacterized protein n=1 Tax=Elysia crispata TaxID=231223 RepID=A0AAE1EA52_9GAST|nr:hypothetical protein RRG08_051385 [Elysia crispata]